MDKQKASEKAVPQKCPTCGGLKKRMPCSALSQPCLDPWHSEVLMPSTPPKTEPEADFTPEIFAIEICRELYDRFVMGGWEPEDAHEWMTQRLNDFQREGRMTR